MAAAQALQANGADGGVCCQMCDFLHALGVKNATPAVVEGD